MSTGKWTHGTSGEKAQDEMSSKNMYTTSNNMLPIIAREKEIRTKAKIHEEIEKQEGMRRQMSCRR